MKIIERTTAPTENTKYYKTNNPFFPTYSMFRNNGNCTDYAYFRFKECNKLEKCNLPPWDAEWWYHDNKTYGAGKTAKVGAVVVWSKGVIGKSSDGCGHVAFVERVNPDKSIVISESGWKSFIWRRRTLKYPYEISGYKLEGFIYSPNEFENATGYTGTYPTLPSRRYFKYGDTGTEVKNLQKLLNYINGDNLVVDGIIGNLTIASVKKFQKNNNLSVDGLFGEKSLARAREVSK